MNLSGTVFLVDDDSALRKAMCQTLELGGLTVVNFPSATQALAQVNADLDGILITDVLMPGMTGLELFEHVRAIDADLPVILITGHGDIPMAVEALRRGAYDFIAKPFPAERMLESARRALEKRRLVLENRRLKEASFDETLPLIGQTPVMERLRNTVRQIADTNVDVLLTGETGSGKEVVASLLHRWSRRAKGNFVALNCGALPEQIMESELFGHETGAFTGAQKKRIGRIEHSSGGTLFLDEIESMSPSTQVQMLRVLEMREVTPLGTNEVRPVDLRVVAAAKVDLGDPAQRKDFREDLYYRLNVVALSIPPLRERRDDVPLLFSHFCHRAGQRFGRDIPDLSPPITRHLAEHDWPGNVRELSHFAERFVLGLEGLPEPQSPPPVLVTDAAGSLPDRLARLEAEIIRETLSRNGGDVRQTIEDLGIPRKTFYDKLQRHGIVRSAFTGKA